MQPSGLLSYSGWGISLEWTEDEQRTLETFLLRFPADHVDSLQRYIRIAAALPRKCVRDVALRAQWTAMQQQLRKRTGIQDPRKPGMQPIPPKQIIPMVPPLPGAPPPQFMGPPAAPIPDGPPTVDGPIAHLLNANLAILNHFRTNMAAFKVHENTQLLVQFRENILQILHAMETMGGVMAEMPQLPVRLNVDLANNFLPSRPAVVLTYDGMAMPPPPQPALNAPGMVPLNGFAPGGGTAPTAVVKSLPVVGTTSAAMPAPPQAASTLGMPSNTTINTATNTTATTAHTTTTANINTTHVTTNEGGRTQAVPPINSNGIAVVSPTSPLHVATGVVVPPAVQPPDTTTTNNNNNVTGDNATMPVVAPMTTSAPMIADGIKIE